VGELIGREGECARLREVLARARQGRSGVLVLTGEPGTGKTALLDYAQAAADGFDVVRFDAVETEAELGFAALHQLLHPFLDRLDSLPAPQRDALGLVFGLQKRDVPPDRFLIGLASLGLLTTRPGRPLLCVVDDAHCLDQASADVLAFVARRLYADSVAMLFAMRETSARRDLLAGLPRLPVSELGAADAGRLLASVEQLYLRETRALPADTQMLLLTMAADASGDPALLWRAGADLGFGTPAAGPAEDRQLLVLRDVVRFRHPLIRSAVYYGSPLAQRQRVHAALAAAIGPEGNLHWRACHLAAATDGPDEAIASDLERASQQERARGGWAAATSLLARAAALSTGPPERARRLLGAAEASCMAGAPGRAQALLDEAAAHRADRRHTGLAQRAQARIYRLLRDPAAATSALLAAAADLGPVDIRLARDTLVEAVVQAQISDQLAPAGTGRGDVARAARSLPLPPGAGATAGDALLDADTVLQLEGLSAAAPALQRAIDAVRHAPADAPELFQWLAAACADATVLADDVALHELAWRLDSEARQQGAAIPLVLALSHTGLSELLAGLLRESERCFDQRSALDEASLRASAPATTVRFGRFRTGRR
jgi:hypothetical protein